jgi:hypothetical protein
MNWEGYGTKQTWPVLWYGPSICTDRLSRNSKIMLGLLYPILWRRISFLVHGVNDNIVI